MRTSAEQVYHGAVEETLGGSVSRRLYVDLDVCATGECETCRVQCSYPYHPDNNGVRSIVELATYYLVCRRCEEPHCVHACPHAALEQQRGQNKLLIRHTMRCVSCHSCSHACPYGTIYPEHVPLIVHNCDYCLDRGDNDGPMLCTTTCPAGALRAVDGEENVDGVRTFLVGNHLIVHSTHWMRDKA